MRSRRQRQQFYPYIEQEVAAARSAPARPPTPTSPRTKGVARPAPVNTHNYIAANAPSMLAPSTILTLWVCGILTVLILGWLLLAVLKMDAILTVLSILLPLLIVFLALCLIVFLALKLYHWHQNQSFERLEHRDTEDNLALVRLRGPHGKTVFFVPATGAFIDPDEKVYAEQGAAIPTWMLPIQAQARIASANPATTNEIVVDSNSGLVRAIQQQQQPDLPPPVPQGTARIWRLDDSQDLPAVGITDLIQQNLLTTDNIQRLPDTNR